MIHYVFSTLACDNTYTNYSKERVNDLPSVTGRVLIKGGTGIATKKLHTPLGIMTSVNDQELAILKSNLIFQMHEKNGYITVRTENADPEKIVAQGMEARDESSPVVPQDYEDKKDGAKPSVKNGGTKLKLATTV